MTAIWAGQDDASQDRAGGGVTGPRHTRRLSDKILVAFHHACDISDYEVAEHLLRTLELMLTRRRNMESLVAAHERLWSLRNPDLEI